MPALTVIAVGKIKNPHLKSLEEDYAKRLRHYTAFEIKEIKENKFDKFLEPGDFVVALDERGKSLTSMNLAVWLKEQQNRSVKNIVFVIGDAYELDPAVKKRANLTLTLSALTLPHELARVFLLEQLYRAHTILRGEKYHH